MAEDAKLLIPLLLALIAVSAFSSGSETALLSFDWLRLRYLARKGNRNAAILERLLQRKDRLIGTILVVNNVCSIASSAIATALAITIWGDGGIAFATAAMTPVLLVLAEIAPKTFAARHAESVGLFVAPFYAIVCAILSPFVILLTATSNGLLRLFGSTPQTAMRPSLSEEEIRTLLSDSKSTALVAENKRQMLRGVFQMSRKTVREVMVPRTRIRAIDISCDQSTAIEEAVRSNHTRLPVFGKNLDHVIGIIHARDILMLATGKREGGMAALVRETFFVPESMKLESLLYEFQKKRTHMAMVVDEYGGVEGLVTLEDVLEEIVGDIRDEHDLEGEDVRFLPGGEALVVGHASIRDVNYVLGLKMPTDVDVTVGGFVTTELKHLPEPGESFVFGKVRFTVERTGTRRVLLVRVTPL